MTRVGTVAQALDWTGFVTKQPPIWAATAAVLAAHGRQRGRRAALRGSVGYVITAVVANLLVKPVVQRQRPPQAENQLIKPLTSSFPSGHAATSLASTLAAAQELPAALVPLALGTATANWSIVRTHSHYVSDVLAGSAVSIAVAWALRKAWPPIRLVDDRESGGADQQAGSLGNRSGPGTHLRHHRPDPRVSVTVTPFT